MKEEGVESMGAILHNIEAQIKKKVVSGIADSLPAQMGKKLNADITLHDEDFLEWLSEQGSHARCCGVTDGNEEGVKLFWVGKDYLKRGVKCPYINVAEAC